jgi:outer membrane biosynthesis protein TonB
MTTVTATLPGSHTQPDTRQRLVLSLAMSVVTHVLVIAMFAGLLKPMLMPVPGRVGQALPIEVALVGVRPIAFTAPPEAPTLATEVPIAPQAVGVAPSSRPVPPPSATQASAPVTTQPFGVSVQSDLNTEAVSADAAPPPGDTSVGPITDSERLGRAQAMRLAQRFPRTAGKRPQLRAPLIVPYPPRAARAHTEARIAVLLLLDATGRVIDTTLFPDEPLFGPTILEALNGARFEPAEVEAKPIPYWVILEFAFTLRRAVPPRRRPE